MTLDTKNSKLKGIATSSVGFKPKSSKMVSSGGTKFISIKVEICFAPKMLIMFSLIVFEPCVATITFFEPLLVEFEQVNLQNTI